MKRRRVRVGTAALVGLLLLSVLAGGPIAGSSSSVSATTYGDPAPARYIVTLRDLAPSPAARQDHAGSIAASADATTMAAETARVTAVDQTVARVAGRHGVTPGTRYHFALQGFAASLTPTQAAQLRADPTVAGLTAVHAVHPVDEAVPAGVKRVRAAPANEPVPARLGDVHVAVLDTGIRWLANDPELNVDPVGVDCSNDATHGSVKHGAWVDVDIGNGHGTHVAGTIGARDTGQGIVGVAPGVQLFAVRVFANVGGSLVGDTETVACGIDWVASTHSPTPPAGSDPIDVANMSIQGPRDPVDDNASCTPTSPATRPTDAEHLAICAATRAGVTFVVAAGNQGHDASSTVPAAYDEVITVAALSDYDGLPGGLATGTCSSDPDDTFASFSNYGPAVDLIAPGTCVESLGRAPGSTHVMSGTSMAAPHVTGAAARYVAKLLLDGDVAPKHRFKEVRAALLASANLTWRTATDPDGSPDRLVDVRAMEDTRPALNLWAYPALVLSGAPPSGTQDLTVTSTVSVQLQRVGLYPGDVSITTNATPAPGLSVSVANPILSGLGRSGLATALTVRVGPGAQDGDVQLIVHARPASASITGSDQTVTLRIDRHRPRITSFRATLVDHVAMGAAPQVRLSWTGIDPNGQIARYELQRRHGPSGWADVGLSSPSTRDAAWLAAPRTDDQFQVRAVDAAGNVGSWVPLDIRLRIRDSSDTTIDYSSQSSWTTRSRATALGGSFRRSRSVGAFAVVTFTGRGVAWVSPTGPGRGAAQVSLDGELVRASVKLAGSTEKPRRVVWASGRLRVAQHTLVIRVAQGTVDLDAILILR